MKNNLGLQIRPNLHVFNDKCILLIVREPKLITKLWIFYARIAQVDRNCCDIVVDQTESQKTPEFEVNVQNLPPSPNVQSKKKGQY